MHKIISGVCIHIVPDMVAAQIAMEHASVMRYVHVHVWCIHCTFNMWYIVHVYMINHNSLGCEQPYITHRPRCKNGSHPMRSNVYTSTVHACIHSIVMYCILGLHMRMAPRNVSQVASFHTHDDIFVGDVTIAQRCHVNHGLSMRAMYARTSPN